VISSNQENWLSSLKNKRNTNAKKGSRKLLTANCKILMMLSSASRKAARPNLCSVLHLFMKSLLGNKSENKNLKRENSGQFMKHLLDMRTIFRDRLKSDSNFNSNPAMSKSHINITD